MQETEEFQKKYTEYSVYKSQVDALANEIAIINTTLNNLSAAKTTIENVNKLTEKQEILVPIGGNAFLKATIDDTKNVLLNIGSNVIVNKSIADALQVIEKQISDLTKAQESLSAKIEDLTSKIETIEPELAKMAEELRKKR